MVVAQLAEPSLLTSEICGSNPNIGEVSRMHIFVNCNSEKTKIKEKEAGNGSFKKTMIG